jgi:hypothetical protein
MTTGELPQTVDQILNANTFENGSIEPANQQLGVIPRASGSLYTRGVDR